MIIGQSGAASNTTFVEAAYLQLFPGYQITPSDLNTFVLPLNATPPTMTRLQVATTLVTSHLYLFGAPPQSNVTIPFNGFIDRAYMQYLGRPITQPEIDHWQAVYTINPAFFTNTNAFLAALLDSQEYLEKGHPFP